MSPLNVQRRSVDRPDRALLRGPFPRPGLSRRSRLGVVSALTLTAGLLVGMSAGPVSAAEGQWTPDDFRVIAHRGAHGPNHDEDTVEAQVAAMRQGASCIET